MTPTVMMVWIGAFFAMVILGAVSLFVLSVFWDGSTGIFTSGTYAANATEKAQEGLGNFFEQLPNVGKLAGVSLIIGVLGLMGIGGYFGYQKIKGM